MPFEIAENAVCGHLVGPIKRDRSVVHQPQDISAGSDIRIDCEIEDYIYHQSCYPQADGQSTDAEDQHRLGHAFGSQHLRVEDPHGQEEEDDVDDNAHGYVTHHHIVVSRWAFASGIRHREPEDIAW